MSKTSAKMKITLDGQALHFDQLERGCGRNPSTSLCINVSSTCCVLSSTMTRNWTTRRRMLSGWSLNRRGRLSTPKRRISAMLNRHARRLHTCVCSFILDYMYQCDVAIDTMI